MFFFLFFLFADEGIKDPNNITINGPPSTRQRNAIYMLYQAVDGPTLNAVLVAL